LRIPRWVALLVWPLAIGAIHIGLPRLLSRRGRRHGWRHGWRQRRPGPANLLGVPPVAAGMGLVGWSLARHFTTAPDESWNVNAALQPEYLLTSGPYQFTRNPMYVGAILIWGGWSVVYGSVPVALGAATITTGLQGAVAWEERQLIGRFGDEWREFAAHTPRWLGRAAAA
jgi:protein-S-isoprenylcysteine O-methyltransferase Ste14